MAAKATKATGKGVQKRWPPEHVSAAVMADLVGLTERRLGQLAENGMPKTGRGLYPLRDALRWYLEFLRKGHDDLPLSGPTRAKIERDLALLKLKKAQGQFFDKREVLDTLLDSYTRLGNALELLATRIGRELNLAGADVKLVRDLTDEMRTNFVRDCGEFIDVGENGPTGQAARASAGVIHFPG